MTAGKTTKTKKSPEGKKHSAPAQENTAHRPERNKTLKSGHLFFACVLTGVLTGCLVFAMNLAFLSLSGPNGRDPDRKEAPLTNSDGEIVAGELIVTADKVDAGRLKTAVDALADTVDRVQTAVAEAPMTWRSWLVQSFASFGDPVGRDLSDMCRALAKKAKVTRAEEIENGAAAVAADDSGFGARSGAEEVPQRPEPGGESGEIPAGQRAEPADTAEDRPEDPGPDPGENEKHAEVKKPAARSACQNGTCGGVSWFGWFPWQ